MNTDISNFLYKLKIELHFHKAAFQAPAQTQSVYGYSKEVAVEKANTALCGIWRNDAQNNKNLRLVMKFWHSKYNPQIRLSQNEMSNISQEISQEFAPKVESKAQELVILPVDPYHLYAYWNLGEDNINDTAKEQPDSDLVLRVYWRPDESHDITETKLWFDVPLKSRHNQHKIRLPIDETDYSAAVGKRCPGHGFDVLTYSNMIHVPRGRMAPPQSKVDRTVYEDILPATATIRELRDSGRMTDYYDEALIDSKIKDTLYEKGIENDIDILLSPGKKAPKKSHYASKNASGQGNYK